MKITIPMQRLDGTMEFHEVDASIPFSMYGLTFAAHRRVIPGIPKTDGWVCVETSSGAVVRYGDTRIQAIRRGKELLEAAGADKVKKEVNKQRRLQKRAGRVHEKT